MGALSFSVISGTTVDEIIPIDLSPAVLTGDAAAIGLSTNGVQATGFSAMVDPDAGQVRLHVPGGVGPGTLVSLEGLRISVPASGIETLDARFSTTKNRLVARKPGRPGHRTSRRRHRHRSFDDPVYTYSSGRVLNDHLGHFTFSEGFARAFLENGGPGRPPQRKSFSRRPRYPGTPNSGSRRLSDHRPGRV